MNFLTTVCSPWKTTGHCKVDLPPRSDYILNFLLCSHPIYYFYVKQRDYEIKLRNINLTDEACRCGIGPLSAPKKVEMNELCVSFFGRIFDAYHSL